MTLACAAVLPAGLGEQQSWPPPSFRSLMAVAVIMATARMVVRGEYPATSLDTKQQTIECNARAGPLARSRHLWRVRHGRHWTKVGRGDTITPRKVWPLGKASWVSCVLVPFKVKGTHVSVPSRKSYATPLTVHSPGTCHWYMSKAHHVTLTHTGARVTRVVPKRATSGPLLAPFGKCRRSRPSSSREHRRRRRSPLLLPLAANELASTTLDPHDASDRLDDDSRIGILLDFSHSCGTAVAINADWRDW